MVVILDEPVPDVRPGFTCTADITTATRQQVTAVPIPAVAVRELIYDAEGLIVKEPRPDQRRKRRRADDRRRPSSSRVRRARRPKASSSSATARVEFVPIKLGIAGDKYFEVLTGIKDGDQVITGPYNSVRGMADGDPVKVDNKVNAKK